MPWARCLHPDVCVVGGLQAWQPDGFVCWQLAGGWGHIRSDLQIIRAVAGIAPQTVHRRPDICSLPVYDDGVRSVA